MEKRINAPNTDELRGIAVIIRKSGMTIKQCAIGYRIICILNYLGIYDEKNANDMDGQNQN